MIRRSVSSFLFLSMLNVMALGDGLVSFGGSACDLMSVSTAQSPAMPDMPDMLGMSMGGGQTQDHSRDSSPKGGCNLPWAPGCTSAAPCGPVATIVVAQAKQAAIQPGDNVSLGDMLAPESPARTPELPPPRI